MPSRVPPARVLRMVSTVSARRDSYQNGESNECPEEGVEHWRSIFTAN
jgi:hypothetical protein